MFFDLVLQADVTILERSDVTVFYHASRLHSAWYAEVDFEDLISIIYAANARLTAAVRRHTRWPCKDPQVHLHNCGTSHLALALYNCPQGSLDTVSAKDLILFWNCQRSTISISNTIRARNRSQTD